MPETPVHARPQEDQAIVLSSDPNTALRQVISTIEKLQGVYERETDVLHTVDGKAFMAMQDDKIGAIREYQCGMSQLLSRRDEMGAADPALKKKLKTMHAVFSQQSRENLEALARMKRCTERLGNTLRQAAISAVQQQRTYSYGENGTITGNARNKAVSSGVSETA